MRRKEPSRCGSFEGGRTKPVVKSRCQVKTNKAPLNLPPLLPITVLSGPTPD